MPEQLEDARSALGEFAVRRTRFCAAAAHGAWTLGEFHHAAPEALALLGGPSAADLDPRGAVFLDIETTGLSGGAGTHVFLVGLAWFEQDELFLWQGLLRGPEEEPAMLAACAERLAAARGVVSFFGKSFDRHRLEDKMRCHGIEPPFAGLAHLDLYHPCRRLYRAALQDGRLRTMERALCGVERERDLPGSMAPAAWLDLLAGRPHRLEDVLRHNQDDVLSLVVLCAHLGRSLCERRADGRELDGGAPALAEERARSLGRLFLQRREPRRALPWLDEAIARAGAREGSRALRLARAEALARTGAEGRALAELAQLSLARDAVAVHALALASRLLAAAGLEGEALGHLERALDLAPRQLCGAPLARIARELGPRRARLERRIAARARRVAQQVEWKSPPTCSPSSARRL